MKTSPAPHRGAVSGPEESLALGEESRLFRFARRSISLPAWQSATEMVTSIVGLRGKALADPRTHLKQARPNSSLPLLPKRVR